MSGAFSDDDSSLDSTFTHDSIGSSYASDEDSWFVELEDNSDGSSGNWKVLDPALEDIVLNFDSIDERCKVHAQHEKSISCTSCKI